MLRILFLAACLIASRGAAADGVSAFQSGLQAFQTNGADALLGIWYPSRNDGEVEQLRRQLLKATHDLGAVLDSQVFAPRDLGRHVQRLYGVIYFEKRPLWLRAEYYSINGRSGFISLEFSVSADEILPLEFVRTQ
ncbi:MAG TPA: hypothetical protein VHF69_09115 [Candidatus Synoicihabitans sp.]|nr:hypothetical protein [Candidatus Synoicihabitans sp.]